MLVLMWSRDWLAQWREPPVERLFMRVHLLLILSIELRLQSFVLANNALWPCLKGFNHGLADW